MSWKPTQREVMQEFFRRNGGDEARTVMAYAAAERGGEALRRSNVRGMSPEEYAHRLFRDGINRGWLP